MWWVLLQKWMNPQWSFLYWSVCLCSSGSPAMLRGSFGHLYKSINAHHVWPLRFIPNMRTISISISNTKMCSQRCRLSSWWTATKRTLQKKLFSEKDQLLFFIWRFSLRRPSSSCTYVNNTRQIFHSDVLFEDSSSPCSYGDNTMR